MSIFIIVNKLFVKNGIRFCIDFRFLNIVFKCLEYLILIVDYLFIEINNVKVFILVDI